MLVDYAERLTISDENLLFNSSNLNIRGRVIHLLRRITENLKQSLYAVKRPIATFVRIASEETGCRDKLIDSVKCSVPCE